MKSPPRLRWPGSLEPHAAPVGGLALPPCATIRLDSYLRVIFFCFIAYVACNFGLLFSFFCLFYFSFFSFLLCACMYLSVSASVSVCTCLCLYVCALCVSVCMCRITMKQNIAN